MNQGKVTIEAKFFFFHFFVRKYMREVAKIESYFSFNIIIIVVQLKHFDWTIPYSLHRSGLFTRSRTHTPDFYNVSTSIVWFLIT